MPHSQRVVGIRAATNTGSRLLVAVWLLASAGLARPATAQHAAIAIVGVVRDSAGKGIPSADVSIPAAHLLTRTDSAGAFSFARAKPGHAQLSVRRLGFVPKTVDIDLHPAGGDTVSVEMEASALLLPETDISAQRRLLWIEDFYRRRARGIGGVYFTRDDIEARHTTRLSDVLRDAPGVRFIRTRDGSTLRFDAAFNFRRDCVPQIWIDGQRLLNTNLDDFPARDIEGVELYAGPSSTPAQFTQGAITICGTIVIWSRVPGT